MYYSKYKAKKTTVDGIVFDSKKESKRYEELKVLETQGEIKDLRLQVKFLLIPKQQGERECSYYADFVYVDKTGNIIVEDCKGVKTPEYRIKRKLMLKEHNIKINET